MIWSRCVYGGLSVVFEDMLGYDQVPPKESIGPLLRFEFFCSARPSFYHGIYLVYVDEPRSRNL